MNDDLGIIGGKGQIGLFLLKRCKAQNIGVREFHREDTKIDTKELIFTPIIIDLLPVLKIKCSKLKRLICFSSTSIEGKSKSKNKKERELVQKLSRAEKEIISICQERDIAWTIFRPTMIYGAGLDQNITKMINFVEKYHFFPMAFNGVGQRQPVLADDLAWAALTCLKLKLSYGKIYNLTGGETLSFYQMTERIFKHLNKKKIIINSNLFPLLANIYAKTNRKSWLNGEIFKRMQDNLTFDSSSAQRDFKYAPRKFCLKNLEDLTISL